MKCLIGIFLLAATAAFPVKAASQTPLAITGTVVQVDTQCINNKPVAQLSVVVQFRNNSDDPILLIPPNLFFERKITFIGESGGNSDGKLVTTEVFAYKPYLEDPFGTPTLEDYDPTPGFVAELRSMKEPLKVLEVGSYYEFRDAIWPKTGFKFKQTAAGKGCDSEKEKPLAEYPYFTVEYRLSLKKFKDSDELLTTLQKRWRPFGRLILDDAGDISNKSQKIALTKNLTEGH
ncbi:MAG: hypothetical protein HOP17_16095 [Acidobacteria bacterium]|nr:hypothetical protein [Acidobacteriota bacterium]